MTQADDTGELYFLRKGEVKLTLEDKMILINGIILKLNEVLKIRNKELTKGNLHSKQTPLHGVEMLMRLLFKSDSEIEAIAIALGL